MNFLQVSGICRQEGEAYLLKDISFSQQEFQKIAIAGATGSGKTTLLKIISGLEQPDAGKVLFDGKRVLGPHEKLIPGHPQIAYLSQYFELRHHYRVEEILQMANKLGTKDAATICEVCRIDHLQKRLSHQLSGGEQQRIALARLLLSAPRLLVLDEPYSNLDAIHTNLLKAVVNDIGEELKLTILLVSHDPHDMLPWADEVHVLQNGQFIQSGSPAEVYHHPGSEHVAALFGKYNLLPTDLKHAFSVFWNKEVNGFVRPEDFKIVFDETQGMKGFVKKVHFMGSFDELEVSIAGHTVLVHQPKGKLKQGDAVWVAL